MTRTFVALLALAACDGDRQPRAQATMPSTATDAPATTWRKAELEVELDVVYKLTMGYGHVWEATVRQVRRGHLTDKTLALSTHDSDVYDGHFKCCSGEERVVVTFARLPERPVALAGFVAEDGTVWEIDDVLPTGE